MADVRKVEISAETKDNAIQIVDALLEQKLITGGQIVESPARFLWKGEVVNMNYFTLNSFTVEHNIRAITEIVEKISVEEVPMISFIPFEPNAKLRNWIVETVA